tara:strand:+ start:5039 stop:5725 length:687 start_codon:yes stop_codon:yes gene_type:complete
MLGGQPVDAVGLATDMARVERVAQYVRDALERDFARAIAREVGGVFEEALDLGMAAETTGGKAVEGLTHDIRKRRMRHKHLATPPYGLVPIADRGGMHPIAGLHPCFHLLRDLAPVLLALQRTLGGHDGLDKLAFRRLVKGEVQALYACTARAECVAQVKMKARIAGEALEVVEDDDVIPVRHCVEIAEKRHHAGALHEVAATGDRVGEDRLDLIALGPGIVAAPGFL